MVTTVCTARHHTGSGAANKNLLKSLFFTIHFCLISKGCISCAFFVNRLIKYPQIMSIGTISYYPLPKLVEIVSCFTYSLE